MVNVMYDRLYIHYTIETGRPQRATGSAIVQGAKIYYTLGELAACKHRAWATVAAVTTPTSLVQEARA